MPLELRHLVIGTVGAMNKHKVALVNDDARGRDVVVYIMQPCSPRDG